VISNIWKERTLDLLNSRLENMALEARRLTRCGSHTDEAARVTEAAAAVGLVRRGSVVVESEICLAGSPLHTYRIATQGLALIALT
jgi:hypothetical protein